MSSLNLKKILFSAGLMAFCMGMFLPAGTEAFADEWFVGLPIRPLRNMEAKNTREHLALKLLGNKDADPREVTKAWLALPPGRKCAICWHMTGHHDAAFVEDEEKPSYT